MENNDFSLTEIRFIKELNGKESNSYIGSVISRSEDSVATMIFKLTGKENPYATRQQQTKHSKKKAKPKDEKKHSIQNQWHAQGIKNQKREQFKSKATRVVDYSKKVLLRIDARTSIYINPDQDPEVAKANYLAAVNRKR